ncbi:sulfatase-like hydrolase/transferase [Maribacter sp. 2307ULW6-5]|uniref:sulfatase-like hydrolase/transferase n=1 Tax=Maribacter sp. 2307ULW6-5 TaxID=3386275 RepID=UPI0039BCB9CF
MRALICCFLFWTGILGSLSAQERPNVLWITIEDTSPRFIGAYGNGHAKTPVIDQLAKEGVRFTNAFSTGTVCSPSRSTIVTGVPTYRLGTGHHRSKVLIPDFIKGFPYYLKQQGYYTSNNSKTDYNLAKEKDFIETAWDESSNSAGWWNRKEEQPFFSVFNFAESHQSRTMSMSYDWYREHVWEPLPQDLRIADTDFEMPPIYRDTPEMRKQMARVYNAIALTDLGMGRLLERLERDGLREDTIIFFFADHGEGMPRGKTNGIDYGYRVPFVIWFPEKYKHLSPWGTAGAVTDELVSFEDLAPTLISLSGAKVPWYLNGRVLLGKQRSRPKEYLVLSSDRADNGPDMVRTLTNGEFTYSRNYMPFLPALRYIRYMEISDIAKQMRADLQNSALDSLQKSLFEERPAEYLFHIEGDPWETKNAVNEKRYGTLLKKMRKTLENELLKARDIHFLPEYELGQLAPKTPYQHRENKADFPFKIIYGAASLSGKRDASTLKKQLYLLKHQNAMVRYWAITGLKSHGKKHLAPMRKQLFAAMEDPYAPVAIIAAGLVYHMYQDEAAAQRLQKMAREDNMDLALLAINEITYLENNTSFMETMEAVRKMPNRSYNVKAACMDYLALLGVVEHNALPEK